MLVELRNTLDQNLMRGGDMLLLHTRKELGVNMGVIRETILEYRWVIKIWGRDTIGIQDLDDWGEHLDDESRSRVVVGQVGVGSWGLVDWTQDCDEVVYLGGKSSSNVYRVLLPYSGEEGDLGGFSGERHTQTDYIGWVIYVHSCVSGHGVESSLIENLRGRSLDGGVGIASRDTLEEYSMD
ncbi:hypothetical protein Tco_0528353 [Tanacetum coccineum]